MLMIRKVYAVLKMWSTGEWIDDAITGEKYSDYYDSQVKFLQDFKETHPLPFRRTMTGLHSAVR